MKHVQNIFIPNEIEDPEMKRGNKENTKGVHYRPSSTHRSINNLDSSTSVCAVVCVCVCGQMARDGRASTAQNSAGVRQRHQSAPQCRRRALKR